MAFLDLAPDERFEALRNNPATYVDPDGRQVSCVYHVAAVWLDGYWFDTGYFQMSCSNSNPRGGIYDSGTETPGLGLGGSRSGNGESGTADNAGNHIGDETQPPPPTSPVPAVESIRCTGRAYVMQGNSALMVDRASPAPQSPKAPLLLFPDSLPVS